MNDYFKCCIVIHLSVFSCKEGMGKHQCNGWTETNTSEGFVNNRICPLLYDPPMVGVILYHIPNDRGMELLLFLVPQSGALVVGGVSDIYIYIYIHPIPSHPEIAFQ